MQRYDLVIYGATGFTGAYILERLVTSEHYKVSSVRALCLPVRTIPQFLSFKGLEIAVAGRNHAKLMETLEAVSKKTGESGRYQKEELNAITGPAF